MNTAYLLTGSNLGESVQLLAQANAYINQKCGKIVQQSFLYETAPWGMLEQPPFINQALELSTTLTPEALMQTLLGIEAAMGRQRTVKYGPRIIDLDVLFYNDEVLATPFLQLPHPAIPQRRFVLVPMVEIAPQFMHPILQESMQTLLTKCSDTSNVQKKMS